MDDLFMYSSINSKVHGRSISMALAASLLLTACGGGGGSGGGSGTDASTPPVTPPTTPAMTDNVLFSTTPGSDVVATINKAGYLRANDSSSAHPLTVALGSAPMKGTGTSAVGNGWLSSAGIFSQSTLSLTSNASTGTYTLKAQSANGEASNSAMQVATNIVNPTLSALAGNYGLIADYALVIHGNSITGTYGYTCSWSGTLSPNGKTIDVTHITFENTKNPTGLACSYAGKEYTGTAFLMGPSAAYAKGLFGINLDDGGSGMPTTSILYYFIKQ
jgi:hypothetical protein